MGVRADQKERTREALVTAGRQLFAEHGYAAVGLSALVATAGVTKGALYHHFDGKAELFEAVLALVQSEVAAAVEVAADAEDDPWEQLRAGCREFLVASTAPGTARIMLVDGPAVLGWSRWRALDDDASGRLLVGALRAAVAADRLAPGPVEPLAHVLSGALNEAALRLAESDSPDLGATWGAIDRILTGLAR
ncbi:TetR/AcrR family transcriptional regulator [Actinomycetospora sp. OC33-EN08]|uniref:TetR/AcrR family transcriptional regulator n=1 Tax=Actinomycetospora aurantiaca TaxID=3129233 RepID=A0ABU8MN83_9PSEU